jgi:uncharacterized membrane protein
MQTWTLVRYGHIVAITFFVGGQLLLVAAVAPALRRAGDEVTMRVIARRFGVGSVLALGLAIATGVALASHYQLWDSEILQLKLMVLVLVGVLTGLHVVNPRGRVISYSVVAASLLVVWFGVKLTYG